MIRGTLIAGMAILLAQPCAAQLVVDDFLSGELFVQVTEPYEEAGVSVDLLNVFASERRVRIGDNGTGTTTFEATGDGILSFQTDGTEGIGIYWEGFTVDVTAPETRVLQLDFSDFSAGQEYLDKTLDVAIYNSPSGKLDVGEMRFGDLMGGATVLIELDAISPIEPFDLTNVTQIAIQSLVRSLARHLISQA